MAAITSKTQAGASKKSGLPISGKSGFAIGKSDKLISSNGKASSSASYSTMNKCTNSIDKGKSSAACYNLAVAKSPAPSSIFAGKTNLTSNIKDKSQNFINIEKKNNSMSAKNNSYDINGVVPYKSENASGFKISSTKSTDNFGVKKVIEKEKSNFLIPKNTEKGIKIDTKNTSCKGNVNIINAEKERKNSTDTTKVDVFRNQREYKQTTSSSSKSFDNFNCAKEAAAKNRVINTNVNNINQTDSNSKGIKNISNVTETTICNANSKNKDESTKNNLDTNKAIALDKRKSSITGLELVKKSTVSKSVEKTIAHVSNSSKDTESYFKTQLKNGSSSEDKKSSVNTKCNDSVCNKVNVVINKKNYESDLSNVFTVKRSEVPMVVPAKPKEKNIKLINKYDNMNNVKNPVNYEDYKGIDRKNKMKTFVMGRKLSLQDSKTLFPKEVNGKMKNKRRGSESINLISKEKTFYLLDKKKNDFRNENQIDFTYKTKANEISKTKKNLDSNEQKPYFNTSGFSTDVINDNYSPSFSAAMAPKRKSKFIFGIIWLPLRKRNKHKNIVYHPHNYDYGERSPSMYPFLQPVPLQ